MRRLSALLDGLTMYRTVTLGLGLIALAAPVLAALGVLSLDPVAIAASLAVCVAACLLTGLAVPRLLGVRPHTESSVITGLLLGLVLWPADTPAGFAGLAAVSAVATLSKYVLTLRGRHVLNPAALALVVAGLAGIATPAWWAGSAGLLPFVLVAGVLVVRRLRRYAFVGVYLLVGGGLNLASSVAAGEAVPAAAWAVVASSPVLFLAAFMLTEPLTTPPRRWQALAVAAVVGVLDGVAFTVGPLHSSPELALLAGNALAFVFGQRRGVRLRVLRRGPVGAGTVELVLAPRTPLAFRPGQYLELCLPHPRPDARGTRRMFSIASPPARTDEIAVAMRLPERPSSFKRAVEELEPGRVLTATGVHGDFTPPADPDTPVLWVAGGIGVTPFASMAAAGAARDAVLAYRVPDADDVPYAEVFEKAGTTVLLFAPAPPAAPPRGWTYAGPEPTGEVLAEHVPDLARRRAYVAGAPAVVADLVRELRRRGVRGVRTDAFSGY